MTLSSSLTSPPGARGPLQAVHFADYCICAGVMPEVVDTEHMRATRALPHPHPQHNLRNHHHTSPTTPTLPRHMARHRSACMVIRLMESYLAGSTLSKARTTEHRPPRATSHSALRPLRPSHPPLLLATARSAITAAGIPLLPLLRSTWSDKPYQSAPTGHPQCYHHVLLDCTQLVAAPVDTSPLPCNSLPPFGSCRPSTPLYVLAESGLRQRGWNLSSERKWKGHHGAGLVGRTEASVSQYLQPGARWPLHLRQQYGEETRGISSAPQ